jgi:cell filamentation protein
MAKVDRDPYAYPGTEVLKNNLGLRDAEKLEKAERVATGARLADLKAAPVKGSFNLAHYSDTHHAIFKDVYPFAGEFRTTEIAKWSDQRKDFTVFLPAEVIVPWLNRHLTENLGKQDGLRNLGRDEFVERTTRLTVDLNAFHPFREGNGRTQREFMRTVGMNAGYEYQSSRLKKDELLEANIKTGFDPTKKDLSLHQQISKAIVNQTRDRKLQQQWDRYVSGKDRNPSLEDWRSSLLLRVPEVTEQKKSAPTPRDWRGTFPEAVRESQRTAEGTVAFVGADWKKAARVRVSEPGDLVAIAAKVGEAGKVYSVKPDGAIHNTVAGRDEYLRVSAAVENYPEQLQKAVDKHFAKARETPARGGPDRGPDIDGL